MMSDTPQEHTELIAVDTITVVNPRVRNQKVFDEIVANIAELGLKRPITVAARKDDESGVLSYELVCGQGRLEAFKVLKQEKSRLSSSPRIAEIVL
ncbi:ParB N-terminal domain-containing protein [Pacificibacter sp. AS14]|uniref:ParB N-terminal domain-containing protein n=1 Tax=Pacificibacter sp. AS14 TaxID=3135785 RepID=UPI003180D7D0